MGAVRVDSSVSVGVVYYPEASEAVYQTSKGLPFERDYESAFLRAIHEELMNQRQGIRRIPCVKASHHCGRSVRAWSTSS
jgi:hypothetical protein